MDIKSNIQWAVEMREMAGGVRARRSARFPLPDIDYRSPDGAYGSVRAMWPVLAIEVSYSQPAKTLKSLARQYVGGSKGFAGAVIGPDIKYETPNITDCFLWRSHFSTLPTNKCQLGLIQNEPAQVRHPIFTYCSAR